MSVDVDVLTRHPVTDLDLHAALRRVERTRRLRRRGGFTVVGDLATDRVVDVALGPELAMRIVPGHRRETAAGSRWVTPVAVELRDDDTVAATWEVLWRIAHRHDGVLVVDGEPAADQGLREAQPGELVAVGGPPDPPGDLVLTTAEVALVLPGDPADCWHHVVAAATGWADDLLGAPAWWDPDGDWVPWEDAPPPAPRTWPIGVRLASADGLATWRLTEDRVRLEAWAATDLTAQLRARLGELVPWGPREAAFGFDA